MDTVPPQHQLYTGSASVPTFDQRTWESLHPTVAEVLREGWPDVLEAMWRCVYGDPLVPNPLVGDWRKLFDVVSAATALHMVTCGPQLSERSEGARDGGWEFTIQGLVTTKLLLYRQDPVFLQPGRLLGAHLALLRALGPHVSTLRVQAVMDVTSEWLLPFLPTLRNLFLHTAIDLSVLTGLQVAESIVISGAPQPPLLSGAWLQGTAATLRRLDLHSADLVDFTEPLPNLRILSISRSSFSALGGLSLADMTPNLEELYVHGRTFGANPEPRRTPAASRLPPSLGVLACHATDLPGMLAGMAASTSLRTLAVQACSYRQTLQAGAALSSLIAPGAPTSPSASRLLGDLTTLSICPEGWHSSDLRAHDLGHHDYVVAESAGEDLPPEHVAAWRSLMNDVPMRRLEVLSIVLFDGQVAPSGCADSLRSLTLYADALPDGDTLVHRVAVRAPSIEHFWVHAPNSLFMSQRTADMLASLPEFGRRCAQLRLFRLPLAMMSSKQDRDRLQEITLELRLKDKADREAWARVREQLVAYKTWAMHRALQRSKRAASEESWSWGGTVPEGFITDEGAGRRTAITSVPWHYASLGERIMAYLGPAKCQEKFEIATNYWPQGTTTLQARRR